MTDISDLASRWSCSGGKDPIAWAEVEEMTERDPLNAFRTIEAIHHRLTHVEPRDMAACRLLAAGPLEMLLVRHGSVVIDEVERLAHDDAEFRKLLCGVWKSTMDDELHARVQKCSDPKYKFI